MKIRNWQKFQHYRNRRPPWIRLYREVAHERKFADLSDRAFRVLVLCWLLASEEEAGDGTLPPVSDIAFCHRLTDDSVAKALRELAGFVEHDASEVLADCGQVAMPEESRVEQSRAEREPEMFDIFWSTYPKKVGRAAAEKAWRRAVAAKGFPGAEPVLAALKAQAATWTDKQFMPHAATWLNGRRWEDEVVTPKRKPQDNVRPAVRETYAEPTDDEPPATQADIDAAMAQASPGARALLGNLARAMSLPGGDDE